MEKPKLKCSICGKVYPQPKRNYTRSHYCGKKCRDKYFQKKYQPYRSKWQRARYDREARIASPDKIQCQICGQWYRMVGGHIRNTHKMTARQYRKQYGFDVKKGQLPADLKKLKADQAIECGGYVNLRVGKKFWFKDGDNVGVYPRSQQTLERLKIVGTQNPHHKRSKTGCLNCGGVLTGNNTKYCCYPCRKQHYKIRYNKSRVKLFN